MRFLKCILVLIALQVAFISASPATASRHSKFERSVSRATNDKGVDQHMSACEAELSEKVNEATEWQAVMLPVLHLISFCVAADNGKIIPEFFHRHQSLGVKTPLYLQINHLTI